MNTNNPAGRGWLQENALWLLRLGQAIYLAKHGWSIIPIEPGGKKPYQALIEQGLVTEWKSYVHLHASWQRVYEWLKDRTINVGVLTGRTSGITVLDVDSAQMLDRVAQMAPEGFQFRVVKTHRGWHLYFKYIGAFLTNQGAPVVGVDLRNDLGMAVLPFSVHENGTVYEWQFPWSPEFPLDLPEMPEALKAWCIEKFNLSPDIEDDVTGVSGLFDDEDDDDYDEDDDDFEDDYDEDEEDDPDLELYAEMWDGKVVVTSNYSDRWQLSELPSDIADKVRAAVEQHGGLGETDAIPIDDIVPLHALPLDESEDEIDESDAI